MKPVTHDPEESLISKRDELRNALLAMDKGWSRHRCNTLLELAKTLEQERFRGGAALAEYVAIWEEVVSIIPVDHPSRFTMLQNLVSSLISVNASIPDFHRAIHHLEAALASMPRGQDRLRTLQLLDCVDSKLSSRCGQIDNCDRAIRTLGDIASLTPSGDSEHARIVCQLGYVYQTRYERKHDVADADSAIMYLLKGLSGPLSHLHRPQVAFDVGKGLFQRFERKGNPDDLHQAIQNFESLVGEPGVEGCDVYESFGGALACRHILFGNDVDIDTAIELRRLAVEMLPAGYPATVHCISNLGISLQQRFGVSKNVVDLDEAILCHQQALEYSPPPQFTSMIANRLGCALFDRFEFLNNPTDLSDAISNLSQAARMTPGSLPEAGIIRANLATALLQLPQSEGSHPGIEGDARTGIDLFRNLVSEETTEPSVRFEASLRWARFEHKRGRFSEALHAYEGAIQLLPLLGWNGVAGRSRMESGTKLVWLSCDAASCAIHAGSLERAVEISEHIRSLFWDGISKFRLNTADLKTKRPELADKLWKIGQELEDTSLRYQISGHMVSGTSFRSSPTSASEEEAQRFRELSTEWENCVQEVRKVPGYERFMLPLPFSHLKQAAKAGPVVILIAGNFHSDALILHYDKPLHHIPLTNLSGKDAADMVVELHTEALKTGRDDGVLRKILGELWTKVCEPVLGALNPAQRKIKQRIWWCPTGQLAFLPLHAAGKYNSSANRPIRAQSVPLKIISSYTVTLGRLLASMTAQPTNICASQADPRVLLVSNGEPVEYDDRFSALPAVAEEVRSIVEAVKCYEGTRLTCLHDRESTVDAVLSKLVSHDYIHFSCHGAQHWAVPIHSGLLLHDRRLRLVDLVTYKGSDGSEIYSPTILQLVFLSACETATGSGYLPDQAVHLAAGMQSIGFKGVIATLWPIQDAFAPSVSRFFYQELFSQPKQSNRRDAGLALYNALEKARQTDPSNLWGWVPYMHLGV